MPIETDVNIDSIEKGKNRPVNLLLVITVSQGAPYDSNKETERERKISTKFELNESKLYYWTMNDVKDIYFQILIEVDDVMHTHNE